MRKEIVLHDQCAKLVIRDMAATYARLSVYARLDKPLETVNAPWTRLGSGKSTVQVHRDWMKRKVRELAAYRKSLLSLIPELPNVNYPEWSEYLSPSNGKLYKVLYSSEKTTRAANEYAERVLELVFPGSANSGPEAE